MTENIHPDVVHGLLADNLGHPGRDILLDTVKQYGTCKQNTDHGQPLEIAVGDIVINGNFGQPGAQRTEKRARDGDGYSCGNKLAVSISGTVCSFIGNAMYSSTKGAVNGIVKGMALDLAKKDIRVNSINPGQIDTDLLVAKGVITAEQMQEEIKKYPLKRFGKPEEVAYAAVYLLSNASSWITGTHLLIDGGYTLL